MKFPPSRQILTPAEAWFINQLEMKIKKIIWKSHRIDYGNCATRPDVEVTLKKQIRSKAARKQPLCYYAFVVNGKSSNVNPYFCMLRVVARFRFFPTAFMIQFIFYSCKFDLTKWDDYSQNFSPLKWKLHTHTSKQNFSSEREIFQLKSRVSVCWQCAAGSEQS